MKKYFVILNLIIYLLTMTACGDNWLRKAPYTVDEMEEYLEEKYQKDFIISHLLRLTYTMVEWQGGM